jgi:hypothetical protein
MECHYAECHYAECRGTQYTHIMHAATSRAEISAQVLSCQPNFVYDDAQYTLVEGGDIVALGRYRSGPKVLHDWSLSSGRASTGNEYDDIQGGGVR